MRRALIGLIASGALAASSAVGAQSLGDRFKQFMGSMDGANGNSRIVSGNNNGAITHNGKTAGVDTAPNCDHLGQEQHHPNACD